MKNTLLILFIQFSSFIFQENLQTKTGEITFEASVPAFEEVKAINKTTTCIFDPQSGEIAVLALMKGFRFKIALMEEHFNKNYVESSKYPKATFKGKIDNFNALTLKNTTTNYTIKGTLELHGKSNPIVANAKLKKNGSGIDVTCSFMVNADDYNIEIPSVVSKKVNKNVSVTCNFNLK